MHRDRSCQTSGQPDNDCPGEGIAAQLTFHVALRSSVDSECLAITQMHRGSLSVNTLRPRSPGTERSHNLYTGGVPSAVWCSSSSANICFMRVHISAGSN